MPKAPTDRQQKGGYAAPVSISSTKAAERLESAKRVGIFELDGVIYDMPASPRADIALSYLEISETEGEDAAAYYLIQETIGADGYTALRSVKGLSDDDFEGIMVRIKAVALPKEKSSVTNETKG